MNKERTKPIIHVKVPFGYGHHRFKIMKRLTWGAVDHLVLQTIALKPLSSEELSEKTSLPKQLITEIVIPLMKAGWIEISSTQQDYQFQATQRGLAVATRVDLPTNKEPITRVRSFIVDPITQRCSRIDRKKRSTFQIHPKTKANRIIEQYGHFATELRPTTPKYDPDISDIYSCVANDDEDIHGFDSETVKRSYADNLRYLIIRVDNNDNISGAPDISEKLREHIIDAANKQRELIELLDTSNYQNTSLTVHEYSPLEKSFSEILIDENQIKIITTPEDHLNHFLSEIRNSHSRLIIHSTFITESCLQNVLEELFSAAQRSVQIDIMWGQTPPETEDKLSAYKSTADSISKIQDIINSHGLSTQFKIHRQPTNSHSKFIISNRPTETWYVTIGSCNWLSSSFNRLEASVCVADSALASQFLDICSSLAMGDRGLANSLSRDLSRLSAWLKSTPTPSIPKKDSNNSTRIRILTAPEHHILAKKACDVAQNEILVCSHRVSYGGDRPIFTPLKAAKRSLPNLSIRVCYGRPSQPMNNSSVKDLDTQLQSIGFQVIRIDKPQIHAKFLAWDTNDLIITSLNWLSASSRGDRLSEIGIHITGGGHAKAMIENIQKTRS